MQASEYCINSEIYTPYSGEARLLLHINAQLKVGQFKSWDIIFRSKPPLTVNLYV